MPMGAAQVSRALVTVATTAALLAVGFAQSNVDPPGRDRPVALTAPRIPPLPEEQWTDRHRQLVATFARGRPDNTIRTLLRVPEIVEGVMPFTVYLAEESSVTPRHRALLILRTAWLAGSRPLWATYAARARAAEVTPEEIRRVALGPEARGWSAAEATVLRLADELYRNASVSDRTWQALAAGYDLFHLMDAVETVNHFTMLSIVSNSFGVQPDPDATDRMPLDIPYRVVAPPRGEPLAMARITPGEGRGIAVGRTFGRYPTLVQRWSPRQTFVNRVSTLSPRHREMLILRTGWNCRSEYEWAQHVGLVGRARDHGLDPVRIAEGPEAPGWDDFERTLLRVADELYRDAIVSDGTWRALTDRFETPLAMSAVVTAGAYRAISMSLNAYGVQLEPGNERFPRIDSR
jgi:alkylhydroperoxidase family enzyme